MVSGEGPGDEKFWFGVSRGYVPLQVVGCSDGRVRCLAHELITPDGCHDRVLCTMRGWGATVAQ